MVQLIDVLCLQGIWQGSYLAKRAILYLDLQDQRDLRVANLRIKICVAALMLYPYKPRFISGTDSSMDRIVASEAIDLGSTPGRCTIFQRDCT